MLPSTNGYSGSGNRPMKAAAHTVGRAQRTVIIMACGNRRWRWAGLQVSLPLLNTQLHYCRSKKAALLLQAVALLLAEKTIKKFEKIGIIRNST